MKPIKLSVLINLGRQDRYLLDVQEGWHVHGDNVVLANINGFLSTLKTLTFPVTVEATDELLEIKKELEKTSANAKLSAIHATRLRTAMGKVRHTLIAEARTQVAYSLTEKRFGVRKLVDEPESFLAAPTFDKLPPLARLDLREAGKCIAFELSTAAAFHLLRATEDTLRSYQKVFVKRTQNEKATWGDVVQSLRTKRTKPKPDENLLNHLDHIRKNFRNPTDHPEMTYDLDGVQDLFSLVLDVLNRMAKELPGKQISVADISLLGLPKAEGLPEPEPKGAKPPQ